VEMSDIKQTVAAIVLHEGGEGQRVLLTLRAVEPFRGQWCLPGGHIDAGEDPADAVVREVLEETGLAIRPVFFDCFSEDFDQPYHHARVHVFVAQTPDEPQLSNEVAAVRWTPPTEACKEELAFGNERILQAYFFERGCGR